jgi:glycosyltransferase involved in cell wall biosynthesis
MNHVWPEARPNADPITVNIAVRGKFHYPAYFNFLQNNSVFARLYFSHGLHTKRKYGLPRASTHNFPISEHVVQIEGRLNALSAKRAQLHRVLGRLWAAETLAHWQRADLLHFLAHGHCLPLIARARRDRTAILAEVVNSHPHHTNALLDAERDYRQLPPRPFIDPVDAGRIITEVSAADVVLAPSDHVKRTFVANGTKAEKIFVLPYAANVHRFRPQPAATSVGPAGRQGPLKIVCVGAVNIRKGQLYLLEAAQRLGPRAVAVTLVGSFDPEMAPLLSRFDGVFRHIPHIPNDRLCDLLHQHEVFVLPTLEEGMAIANCEAMASGLCVVTTTASGAGAIIRHGQNGFLVPSRDVDALTDQLANLVQDRALAFEIGRCGALDAQDHVNWECYTRTLAKLYRTMAR